MQERLDRLAVLAALRFGRLPPQDAPNASSAISCGQPKIDWPIAAAVEPIHDLDVLGSAGDRP
jgi:hypothetical protein